MTARLSGLTIGALTLTPAFDKDTTSYAAATTNASNKVTAIPEDVQNLIEVKHGTTVIENATAPTWDAGENTITVTVTDRNDSSITTTYTVTVTKT